MTGGLILATLPIFKDGQFWAGLWKIVVADIILAGDNAVVIALAVRSLPAKQQFWGRIFGALGAVGLRILFVVVVSSLLQVPYLQLVGGILLVWIAWRLVRPPGGESDNAEVKAGASLWQAIWVIVLADVVMSFDNVMAISGASLDQDGHTQLPLVAFGLLLSIPLVVFGSGLLSALMTRMPVLVWLGAGLLGHVAGHMMFEDDRVQSAFGASSEMLEQWFPIVLFTILVAAGWWTSRQNGSAAIKAAPGAVK